MNSRQFTELPQDVVPGIVSFSQAYIPGSGFERLSRGFRYEAEQNAQQLLRQYQVDTTDDASLKRSTKFQLQRAALDKNWDAMRVLLTAMRNPDPSLIAYAIILARINGNPSLAERIYRAYASSLQGPEYVPFILYYDTDRLINDVERTGDISILLNLIPDGIYGLFGWINERLRSYILTHPEILNSLHTDMKVLITRQLPEEEEFPEFSSSEEARQYLLDRENRIWEQLQEDPYSNIPGVERIAIENPNLTINEIDTMESEPEDVLWGLLPQNPKNEASLKAIETASASFPGLTYFKDSIEVDPIIYERLPHLFQ